MYWVALYPARLVQCVIRSDDQLLRPVIELELRRSEIPEELRRHCKISERVIRHLINDIDLTQTERLRSEVAGKDRIHCRAADKEYRIKIMSGVRRIDERRCNMQGLEHRL